MKKLMILALCAAVVPAAFAADSCQPWGQARGEWTCLTGGAVAEAQPVVLRTSQDWAKFWAKHTGSEAAPAVDFTKQQVLAYEGADASAFKAVKVAAAQAEAAKDAAVVTPSQALKAAEARVSKALSGVRAAQAKSDSVVASANAELASLTGFDGGSLRDAVVSPAMPAPELIRVGCTEGVDCPTSPRSSTRPQSRCTEGVDCPAPRKPQSRCTEGVDCPSTPRAPRSNCTVGVDCPNDGGTPSVPTPAPNNYYPRPSQAPSTFPDWRGGGFDRYNSSPDVSSYWMSRRDAFGDPIEDAGGWTHTTARGAIERAGSEKGTQGTSYRVTLVSQESRAVYRLYWRYVGYNCDPNDSTRCRSWSAQQAWFFERNESGRASAMTVRTTFLNDQPLLPWETETIAVTFDGSRVGVDASAAAFRYSVHTLIDQQANEARVELTPVSRVLRAPEFDKVTVRLENRGGRLMMIVDDKRASFYQGERLELGYQVMRKCSGFWECTRNFGDIKVSEVSESSPVSVVVTGNSPTYEAALPTSGSGQYYVNWFFRRAQSKLSNDSWSGWKATDRVQF